MEKLESPPGLRRRFLYRCTQAVPPLAAFFLGATAWGAAMGLSVQLALWMAIAAETFRYWQLTILFFAGGLIAWPIAIFFIRFSALGRSAEIWFAASIVFLTSCTIGVTSAIFALLYRSFYVQWHGEVFSMLWFVQLVFTTASALYQFAVIGLRLYLPLGALFLLAAALIITMAGSLEDKRRALSTV